MTDDRWDVYAETPATPLPPEPTTWQVYGDPDAEPEPSVRAGKGPDGRPLAPRPAVRRTPQDPRPRMAQPPTTSVWTDDPKPTAHDVVKTLVPLIAVVLLLLVAGGSYAQYQRTEERRQAKMQRAQWDPGFPRPDRKDVADARLAVDIPGWTRSGDGLPHPPDKFGMVARTTYAREGVLVLVEATFSKAAEPLDYGTPRQHDEGVLCLTRSWGVQCAILMNRGHIELRSSAALPQQEVADMAAAIYRAQP